MNQALSKIAQNITDEFGDLEQVVHRTERAWVQFQQVNNDLYLDSVALNLHGFYSGLERLFEQIAREIDKELQGANWHQRLLEQMSVEKLNFRPPVISQESYQVLDEYRGLRHIVRNFYAFRFDADRLQPLAEILPEAFAQVRSELLAFAAFLEAQA